MRSWHTTVSRKALNTSCPAVPHCTFYPPEGLITKQLAEQEAASRPPYLRRCARVGNRCHYHIDGWKNPHVKRQLRSRLNRAKWRRGAEPEVKNEKWRAQKNLWGERIRTRLGLRGRGPCRVSQGRFHADRLSENHNTTRLKSRFSAPSIPAEHVIPLDLGPYIRRTCGLRSR